MRHLKSYNESSESGWTQQEMGDILRLNLEDNEDINILSVNTQDWRKGKWNSFIITINEEILNEDLVSEIKEYKAIEYKAKSNRVVREVRRKLLESSMMKRESVSNKINELNKKLISKIGKKYDFDVTRCSSFFKEHDISNFIEVFVYINDPDGYSGEHR